MQVPQSQQNADYLDLRGLTKYYAAHGVAPAVDNVSLTLQEGKLLALLGPSGCGKTTTLRMLAGLLTPSSGEIHLAGKPITQLPVYKRGIGMVFQSYALFPHMSVAENIAFGLQMRRVARQRVTELVHRALDLVHLSGYGDRRISQLSGGQQQRIALARAIVIEPSLLLLDEPLSNLDAKLRDTMREELKRIQNATGVTSVFVTHDQSEALALADVIAVMNEGHIEQIGTPEEVYEAPASMFTARFIGQANIFDAIIAKRFSDSTVVEIPRVGRITVPHVPEHGSGGVALMVRPHRVRINPPDTRSEAGDDLILPGTVTTATYTGERISYGISVSPEVELTVETVAGADDERYIPGASISVHVGPKDLYLIPDDAAADGRDSEAV